MKKKLIHILFSVYIAKEQNRSVELCKISHFKKQTYLHDQIMFRMKDVTKIGDNLFENHSIGGNRRRAGSESNKIKPHVFLINRGCIFQTKIFLSVFDPTKKDVRKISNYRQTIMITMSILNSITEPQQISFAPTRPN